MIPSEDFTDMTLVREDTDEHDDTDDTDDPDDPGVALGDNTFFT